MIYETYIIVSGTQSRINVTLLSYILSYDPFKMPTPICLTRSCTWEKYNTNAPRFLPLRKKDITSEITAKKYALIH